MKYVIGLFFFFVIQTVSAETGCTLELQLQGAISPASLDYLERAQAAAQRQKCSSIFLKINTPGGNLQTTRYIVELIMSSNIPYLCLVSPSGGHAGSAGAIIMQACHVNGALEATNIGAATPISSMGGDLQKDLRKKMVEDTQSWVQGLANFYGRNESLAGELVTEAKSLPAAEAAAKGLIDYSGYKVENFLEFAEGRKVKMPGGAESAVRVGAAEFFEPDIRFHILDFSTDPQWSYLIFMGSIALIYFEITHPGTMAPGILGSIGLIVSLISFHKLQVYWGGVALILLGLALITAEFFIISMGLLAIGGAVSFVLGSFLLFDLEKTGVQLHWTTILPVSAMLLLIAGGLSYLAYRTFSMSKQRFGNERLIGDKAIVTELEGDSERQGWIRLHGEIWKFNSHVPVAVGDEVYVEKIKGMNITVKKES